MTWDSAPQYPSGVYASSKSCWTSSTWATFFAASSSTSPATPLPITNALTVLEVSLAICCAAASVSKLVLFHFPCRCSAMTRIFISNHPRLKLQLLHQLAGYLFRRAGQEFRLLRFRRHINFLHALRELRGNTQRLARDGGNFLLLRSHDSLQRRVAHLVDARLNAQHRGKRALNVLEPPGLQLALQFHFLPIHFDGHYDGRVRHIQHARQQHARLCEPLVIALQTGQHQIVFLLLDGRRNRFRRAQRIELREIIVGNVNTAVRALGQRLLDRLLHALRPHRKCNHFAAVFFLQPQSFFQRVAVRLVHLKADIRFTNPVAGDGERRVFGGNLLDAHDNIHGIVPICCDCCDVLGAWPAGIEILRSAQDDLRSHLPPQRLKINAALVPPNPKEFDNAYSTAALRA